MSIDAEGWDALVVEGMARMLRERRVELLEFEYKKSGYWVHNDPAERRSLSTLVASLGSQGYTCFWQVHDRLLRVTGQCWSLAYEGAGWSNLLCAHSHKVVALLGARFGTTATELVRRHNG